MTTVSCAPIRLRQRHRLPAAATYARAREHVLGPGAIDYTLPEWSEAVLAATGGRGADIILDAVGGSIGEASLAGLAPFGRLVVYGVSSSRLASFAGSQLMQGNQSVTGYWLTSRLHQHGDAPSPTAGIVPELLKLADSGKLRGVVQHAYSLEDAADAHRSISARRSVGKVVLTT